MWFRLPTLRIASSNKYHNSQNDKKYLENIMLLTLCFNIMLLLRYLRITIRQLTACCSTNELSGCTEYKFVDDFTSWLHQTLKIFFLISNYVKSLTDFEIKSMRDFFFRFLGNILYDSSHYISTVMFTLHTQGILESFCQFFHYALQIHSHLNRQ